MSPRLRAHIRSNVVGYVAVFIALSGTAGALPGRNGVDSGDIRKGAVRSIDALNNSLGGIDLRDNSVKGRDVDESTLGGVSPAGAAGGDLVGFYPNPLIAANAVSGAKVEDNSLTGDDVNEASLQGVDAGTLDGHDGTAFGAVLTGRINGLDIGNASEHAPPSGTSTPSATHATASHLSPTFPLVARDFNVSLTAPPVSGNRFFYLVVNGADTIQCLILASESTCSSGASVVVPASSTLSIRAESAQFPQASDARFGFRLTP